MKKELITQKGREKLMKNLRELQDKRPQIVQAIATARAMGDLSENADYHAAKEQQGLIESKIKELENLLAIAETPDIKSIDQTKTAFGATVTLLDLGTSKEITYELVGPYESDIKQRLISIYSPLGKALIGKKVQDITEVELPNGTRRNYKILSIIYGNSQAS